MIECEYTNLNNGYVKCDRCQHTMFPQDAYWHTMLHASEYDDNVW